MWKLRRTLPSTTTHPQHHLLNRYVAPAPRAPGFRSSVLTQVKQTWIFIVRNQTIGLLGTLKRLVNSQSEVRTGWFWEMKARWILQVPAIVLMVRGPCGRKSGVNVFHPKCECLHGRSSGTVYRRRQTSSTDTLSKIAVVICVVVHRRIASMQLCWLPTHAKLSSAAGVEAPCAVAWGEWIDA
jgi:hypothetical protein